MLSALTKIEKLILKKRRGRRKLSEMIDKFMAFIAMVS